MQVTNIVNFYDVRGRVRIIQYFAGLAVKCGNQRLCVVAAIQGNWKDSNCTQVTCFRKIRLPNGRAN